MRYCEKCQCNQPTEIIERKEIFNVKGEPVEVLSDVLICAGCSTELFDEGLDARNLEKAFNEYRKKHNLMSPLAIRELRERWGSGRLVATLLGWSQATFVRYEKGAIPDMAHHEQLVKLRDDPEYIKTLYQRNHGKLSPREQIKLSGLIEETIKSESGCPDLAETLIQTFRQYYREGTTVTEFDFEKLANTVQFFATCEPRLTKTKLQKLLFYTEFLNTKRYGEQIIGLPFVHHYYGPVPLNHELVHACLVTTEVIDTRPYEGAYEGEIIFTNQKPNMNLFTPEEIDVLQTVADYFKEFNSARISEFSHREKGYLETAQKSIIPYFYAKDLLIS
jgi:putative zinc finger/helix-turn-helix YgiT family protein